MTVLDMFMRCLVGIGYHLYDPKRDKIRERAQLELKKIGKIHFGLSYNMAVTKKCILYMQYVLQLFSDLFKK